VKRMIITVALAMAGVTPALSRVKPNNSSFQGKAITAIRISMLTCLLLAGAVVTFAQLEQAGKAAIPTDTTVTVSISSQGLRFIALGNIAQMRLEVFNASGAPVYTSDFKTGNVQDWTPEDQLGQPLPDGSYLCIITLRDLAGRVSLKQGSVVVQAGQVSLNLGEAKQAGGAEKALAAAPDGSATTVTLLAHDGKDGQLVSTQGGLTFRVGDFFARQDKELLRLTPEGKLGLGVTDPQTKLDVAGPIRTSEGVVFPDGTIQTTAYVASGRTLSARSGSKRDAQGRTIAEEG
jgi:hypothetical protein